MHVCKTDSLLQYGGPPLLTCQPRRSLFPTSSNISLLVKRDGTFPLNHESTLTVRPQEDRATVKKRMMGSFLGSLANSG